MSYPGQLAAVLWDFDGTIADSEPIWMQAQSEIVGELGTWTHTDGAALIGNSLIDSGKIILQKLGRTDLDPAQLMDQMSDRVSEIMRTQPLPWRPGARELLQLLAQRQIKCALVSASYRRLLEVAIAELPGVFSAVVAGDEVTHGKPHPQPYLRACEMLQVDPGRCVAIEDSNTGAASANAAGAVVLGVQHLVPIRSAPRREVIETLVGVDLEYLEAVVRRH